MTNRPLRAALIVLLGGLLGTTACQELDVKNPNAPDRARALATAGDVASLIGGSFRNYFSTTQQFHGPGPAMSVAADDHTSSWGNFGMKHFGNEPRLAINNNPAWGYAYVIENPWYWSYGTVVSASDGLRAIQGGLEIGPDGEHTVRTRAFAKMMQGLATGYLALTFDRAFVVDETVDLQESEPQLQSYDQVMAAALGYLNDALAIANGNTFTLPDSWINGRALTNDQMARLIHSYMARFMASAARSPQEREAVDWAAVANHVDQGIQEDFWIQGTGWTGFYWSGYKTYGGDFPIWARTDLRTLGPADTDGDWQAWEQTAPEQRTEFLINTPDRRITQGTDQPTTTGKYFTYYPWIAFRPGRGTYHFSNYGDIRWGDPRERNQIVEMNMAEMDLLKAEALARTGDAQGAVDLINKTRVANGELPPVTADGVPQSDTCVPQTMDGGCGDLMEALKYEKRIETWHVSAGMPYFDDRGWGDLVTGTPVQFPIPGKELQVLQQEIYTFGGAGGESAAPSTSDMTIGERIEYDLKAMRRMWHDMVEARDEHTGSTK